VRIVGTQVDDDWVEETIKEDVADCSNVEVELVALDQTGVVIVLVTRVVCITDVGDFIIGVVVDERIIVGLVAIVEVSTGDGVLREVNIIADVEVSDVWNEVGCSTIVRGCATGIVETMTDELSVTGISGLAIA